MHEQIKILKQKLINISGNSSNANHNEYYETNSKYTQEIEHLNKLNNNLKYENDKLVKQIKLFEKQKVCLNDFLFMQLKLFFFSLPLVFRV